jgi:chemotaxis receptor (MCP) glutamine deamidase CheD
MPRKKSHAPGRQPRSATPDMRGAFERAMALPTPDYPPLKDVAAIDAEKTMLVEYDQIGLTNSRSIHPILGTAGFGTCIVVILYDRRTKTAALLHDTGTEVKSTFKTLLEYFPGNRQLELHVLGGTFSGAVRSEKDEKYNLETETILREFADMIAGMDNITLKTFDVFSKLKPTAIAIDARNGKLIAGSGLYRIESDANFNVDMLEQWNHAGEDNHFDGTAPEFQK